MKTEIVCRNDCDWTRTEPLSVGCYPWGGEYRPVTTARVLIQNNVGLRIRMECRETKPKRTYTQPDSPVCRDSCLECFLNPAPEGDFGYLNLECNANGALHAAYGRDRNDRVFLRDIGVALPQVNVQETAQVWSAEFTVPFSLLEALYQKPCFQPGDEIAVNFYKCGDETDPPHYGCWSPIETPQPDFHRPEFFGRLVVRTNP